MEESHLPLVVRHPHPDCVVHFLSCVSGPVDRGFVREQWSSRLMREEDRSLHLQCSSPGCQWLTCDVSVWTTLWTNPAMFFWPQTAASLCEKSCVCVIGCVSLYVHERMGYSHSGITLNIEVQKWMQWKYHNPYIKLPKWHEVMIFLPLYMPALPLTNSSASCFWNLSWRKWCLGTSVSLRVLLGSWIPRILPWCLCQ